MFGKGDRSPFEPEEWDTAGGFEGDELDVTDLVDWDSEEEAKRAEIAMSRSKLQAEIGGEGGEIPERLEDVLMSIKNEVEDRYAAVRDMPQYDTEEALKEFVRSEAISQAQKLQESLIKVGAELPRTPEEISDMIIERMWGWGELQKFLDDPEISEIMINGTRSFYYERNGQMKAVEPHPYPTEEDIMALVDKIKTNLPGVRFDNENLLLDSRMKLRGSVFRLNAAHSLLSIYGPAITIRKPIEGKFSRIDQWVTSGSIPESAADFLMKAFASQANILIVGGTGSGKTTFLRTLTKSIPIENERPITVEDVNEIKLDHPNSVALEAFKGVKGNEGQQINVVNIGRLLQNAMRMRPSRILVGECRAPDEVTGLLQAINTGHDGSITTTHASSAALGLRRLLTLASMSEDKMGLDMVGELISNGLDLVVYISRTKQFLPDGSVIYPRKVMQVGALVSFDPDRRQFAMEMLFERKEDNEEMWHTGAKPPERFYRKMELNGWQRGEIIQILNRGLPAVGQGASNTSPFDVNRGFSVG